MGEGMRANEITQAGFYWYRDGDAWETVEVQEAGFGLLTISFIGTELNLDPCDISGEFVGPLKSPA